MRKQILLSILMILLIPFIFGKSNDAKIDDILLKLKNLDKLDKLDKFDITHNLVNQLIQRSKSSMQVFGTEYNSEQEAKVWLQLINLTGDYVNDGICYVDIYTPDNEEYLERATMNSLNHDGVYYYDLPVPIIEGVYPVIARCYYNAVQVKYYPNNYLGTILKQITIDGTIYTATQSIDANKVKLRELKVPVARLDVYLSWSPSELLSCTLVSEDLLTSLTISLYGRFNSVVNDDITISIYNWTSASWIVLPNVLLENNVFKYAVNSISTNNITKSGLYDSVNGTRVRFTDTAFADGGEDDLEISELFLSCDQLANPEWQDVKGSSEIHITYKEVSGIGNYYVQTLCSKNDEISISSACSEFRNNLDYWNYTWGYIYENITFINSFQTETNDVFYYETELGQDCTSIIDIYYSTNDTYIDFLDEVDLATGNKQNCVIRIPVRFNTTDREFKVQIREDNYMRWEFQRAYDFVNYFKLIINPFCNKIALEQGNPYEIPLEQSGEKEVSTLYKSNPIYLGCYRTIDDLYWFDYYYNESLSVNVSGIYESYLLKSQFYYPEIKDSAQIVQTLSSDTGELLFQSATLCGESDSKSSGCAIAYPPDTYFSSQEGYIVENITITNLFNIQFNSTIQYLTPKDVDCTAILEILEYDVDEVIDRYNDSTLNLGDDKNCKMTIPFHLNNNQTNNHIVIIMENYIHWNMFQMLDKVNSVRESTESFCNDLAVEESFVYDLPINESIAYINNSDLEFCYRTMDDLYWWDFFTSIHDEDTENHTLAVPIGTHNNIYVELLYFYPFIMENYDIINLFQRNQNQILTLSMLSDVKNNTHLRVWNHTSRNLTYYPTSNINATAIAEEVWSWDGFISDNILTRIAEKIWSYTFGRYTNGESNQ